MAEIDPTEPTDQEQGWLRSRAQKGVERITRQGREIDERLSASNGKFGEWWSAGKDKGSDATSKSGEKAGQFVSQMDSSVSEAVRNRLLAEYREAVDEALETALQVVTAQATHIEILEKQIADLEAEHE